MSRQDHINEGYRSAQKAKTMANRAHSGGYQNASERAQWNGKAIENLADAMLSLFVALRSEEIADECPEGSAQCRTERAGDGQRCMLERGHVGFHLY